MEGPWSRGRSVFDADNRSVKQMSRFFPLSSVRQLHRRGKQCGRCSRAEEEPSLGQRRRGVVDGPWDSPTSDASHPRDSAVTHVAGRRSPSVATPPPHGLHPSL